MTIQNDHAFKLTDAEREGLEDTTDNDNPDDIALPEGDIEGEIIDEDLLSDEEAEAQADAEKAEAANKAEPTDEEKAAAESRAQQESETKAAADAVKAAEDAVQAALTAQKDALAAVADKEAALTALTDELEGLADKLENGELTDAQYSAKVSVLNVKIRQAEKALDKAETAAESTDAKVSAAQKGQADANAAKAANEQAGAMAWSKACDDFLALPENKLFTERKSLWGALDAAVREVAEQNPGFTHQQILTAARAEVAKDFNLPGKKADDKPPARQKQEIPKTLGTMPAAMGNEDGNEFTHLDSLTGAKFESAFGKLSYDQQKRYLTGR